MKIAFYKGKGLLYDKFVKWWTKSPYSHAELILEELGSGFYLCGSSSLRDGGVREKVIWLNPERWDIVEVLVKDEQYAKNWFRVNYGKKYDLWGQLGVISPFPDNPENYWCSEAIAAALQIAEPYRYAPSHLYSYAKTLNMFK